MGNWARTLAAAIAIAMAVAIPAQAANYPSGGSDFAGDAQGWVGSGASCSLDAGTGLCTTTLLYEAGVGNPPGSITVRMNVTANLLGVFAGTGTWTSPSFTIPAGQPVTGATFQYDRQLAPGGLVNLDPESEVTVTLVDLNGPDTELPPETLTDADSAWAARGVGVPAGALVEGHSYQIQIVTETSTPTASLGILGQDNTRFDNVVLAVDQATGGGGQGSGGGGGEQGGTTPIVSEGVTVTKSFRSDSQISALFGRYDEGTLVGRGPGGSLVPLSACTIVGTARADRITGTRGNDVICGLGGNDVINGAGGVDIIDGANGRDRLLGGPARDKLIGLRGNDRLYGNAGNDRVGGGAGRDRMVGAGGGDRFKARDRTRDSVNGGKGRDRATVDRLARGTRRSRGALRRADRVVRVERVS
jgi:Ca2+-binding RTX toxin-like protein